MFFLKEFRILLLTFSILTLSTIGFFFFVKTTPIQDFNTLNISQITNDEKKLEEVLTKIGIKKAMEKLIEESKGGSEFDCHQQAHQIGRIGYKIYKEIAFAESSAACHSGAYHGAMETFLAEVGTQDLALKVDAICKLFDTSFGIFECLHGVGHGILAYLDYDLPQALETCQLLKTDFDKSSCYGGVFMENIVSAQGQGADPAHKTEWANDDLQFPCNKIDQDKNIQYQCYQMQTSWMLTLTSHDFDKVGQECLKVPKEMIPVCFKSFGRDAAGFTLREPAEIVNLCEKVPKKQDFYDQCITGAVNVIVDFWGPNLKEQAAQLCKLLPETNKKSCYSVSAGRLLDVFRTQEERQMVCKSFETKYQNLCQS